MVRSGILKHTLPVAVAQRDVTLNQDLKAIELHDGLEPEYVAWALRAAARDILHTCSKSGTTVQNLEIPRFLHGTKFLLLRSTNNSASWRRLRSNSRDWMQEWRR